MKDKEKMHERHRVVESLERLYPELGKNFNFMFGKLIHQHHRYISAKLSELGLYKGQPFLLLALESQNGRTQKEICEFLNVKPPTVAQMVQRMEKAGFVIKKSDPNDLRATRIYITDKGKDARDSLFSYFKVLEDSYFTGFTDGEKLILNELLSKLSNNIKQLIDDQGIE